MEAYIHTYTNEYKVWTELYNIYIFDIGERLTIALIPSKKLDIIDTLKKFYLIIDVEVESTNVDDIVISNNTKHFILDTINSLFEEEEYKTFNINKLKKNLLTIIDFEKLIINSSKCKNIQWNSKCLSKTPENTRLNKSVEIPKNQPIDTIEPYDIICKYHSFDLDNNTDVFSSIQIYAELITDCKKENLVILFNNIYNISIVIKYDNPEEFCSIFTEWKIVHTLEKNDKYFDDLNDKFHIKTFESYDMINKKIKAFIDYYDINIEEKNTSVYKINKVDFNVIKELITSKYIINTNEEDKIKSLFLIEETMNLLKINNYVCPKSALPGLFLECGLKKKRYSDGIYYYGLKLIESMH
jgi:hypothetical protein